MKDQKDFSYYSYCDKLVSEPDKDKLEWIVIIEDWNAQQMVPYNIFNHVSFVERVKEAFKESKNKTEFEERLRHVLLYYYWSKSEWEFIATSWPPYVNGEEIDRLNNERQEKIDKYGKFYRADVRLNVAKKLDVYTQIRMNWSPFVNYVWTALKGE